MHRLRRPFYFLGRAALFLLYIGLFALNLYPQDDSFAEAQEPKKPPESKFLHQVELYMTYTHPVLLAEIPNRHTYIWMDVASQYYFNKNSSISNTTRVYKNTISNPVSTHPYQIMVFPVFMYQGSFAETLLREKNSILGENHIDVKLGSINDFTPSKGLIYSQFTGLGFDGSWDLTFGAIDFSFVSHGYQRYDDVICLYFYSPKRYIGFGALTEFNAPLGARLVPEVNFEFGLGFQNFDLNFFGELGVNYLIASDSGFRLSSSDIFIDRDRLFSEGFSINKNTLAGLSGFELKYKNQKTGGLKGSLRGEYRYYGIEYGDFYYESRLYGFEFYTDIRSDEKYNNQPFNFFLYPGYNHGIYIRTELEFNPLWKVSSSFLVKLRNEFLFVLTTYFDFFGDKNQRRSGNDIFSVIFTHTPWKRLTLNLKISNILIGAYEGSGRPIDQLNPENPSARGTPRGPFFLESSDHNVIADIYLHFKF